MMSTVAENPDPGFAPRVLVIVNPVAGRLDRDEKLELVRQFLVDTGWDGDVRVTTAEGEAREWARQGTREVGLVLALGGDGTIAEVMAGLVESEGDAALAQVPCGTANLLAAAFGFPKDPAESLSIIARGRVVTLDVGHLPDHDRYFTLVAGAGWDAEMIDGADRAVKDRMGFLAYVVSGVRRLFHLEVARLRLVVDGTEHRLRGHTIMAMNVGELKGANIALGEKISPHDGKLDLAVAAPRTWFRLLHLVWRIFRRDFREKDGLKFFSGRDFEISSEPRLKLEIDGEVIGKTPFRARVIPGALRFVVPEDYANEKQLPDERICDQEGVL